MSSESISTFINNAFEEKPVDRELLLDIISNINKNELDTLCGYAQAIAKRYYENKVYVRGLIEFTNYCKNNCHYCGINKSIKTNRYRLTEEQILECCENAYNLGIKTFVLQGGEDPFFSVDKMVSIVKQIKEKYTDCAITLSIGEKADTDYALLYNAGADRFLLRHETATKEHYEKLHPKEMDFQHRMDCLYCLKKIGYATGAGFMVGSPYQTNENLVDDLMFICKLKPQMVGIGPFIPHSETIFKDYKPGRLNKTLCMLALTRILLPKVLLPTTTALSTISKNGKNLGVLAGCNVVMVNFSPKETKADYLLYNDKACLNEDAKKILLKTTEDFYKIGYQLDYSRGDYKE